MAHVFFFFFMLTILGLATSFGASLFRMKYSCHLEIPAREDAMFQVQLEGVGRMYPNIEGANPSIRHELLGPEGSHHDAAALCWFHRNFGPFFW